MTSPYFSSLFLIVALIYCGLNAQGQDIDTLDVGLAGTAPFVSHNGNQDEGISVEIWESIAAKAGYAYRYHQFEDVPAALMELQKEALDMVAGPVSITAERAETLRFTQPYFLSSLVIASRATRGSVWQHIKPFFNLSFFSAVAALLIVLTIVGILIWLSERKASPEQFPGRALPGIFNGMWFALVTMTTVGYGDKAPRTVAGKIITGIWMIIALVTATSLIAGISSTITVSKLSASSINSAEKMLKKNIAVIDGSPAEMFVRKYGGHVVLVPSLKAAFEALNQLQVAAIVYDRPQVMYYLREHPDPDVAISTAEYMPQGYGFALRKDSGLASEINIRLLRLQESGAVEGIVNTWLGDQSLAIPANH